MNMNRSRRFAVVAVSALPAGCSAPSDSVGASPVNADELESVSVETTISGTVVDRKGCFMLDTGTGEPLLWIIWPVGSKQANDNTQVRLDGGTMFQPGDPIEIDGALISRADLPEGTDIHSYWGAPAQFCLDSKVSADDEIILAARARVP